jgi:hypothetical protein
MFNKKIVLSVLFIALVGMGAAGTWANFTKTTDQSGHWATVTASSTNPLSLKIVGTLSPDLGSWTDGLSVIGAIPDNTKKSMGFIRVQNNGLVTSALQLTSLTVTPTGNPLDNYLELYIVDGNSQEHLIYAGYYTPNYGNAENIAANPLAIYDAMPKDAEKDIEIKYKFVNTNFDQTSLLGTSSSSLVNIGFTLTGAYV